MRTTPVLDVPFTPAAPSRKRAAATPQAARRQVVLPPLGEIHPLTEPLYRLLIEQADNTYSRYWLITPEMAAIMDAISEQAIREREEAGEVISGENRNYRSDEAIKYSVDMADRNWARNGATIAISSAGICMDGSHRLSALRIGNVPVELQLFFGAELDTRRTIDRGIPRTLGDSAKMEGVRDPSAWVQIAAWYWKYERGNFLGRSSGGAERPSDTVLFEWAARKDGLIEKATEWALYAAKTYRKASARVYGMAWLLLHAADYEKAELFLQQLVTSAEIPAGDVMLKLRYRLDRNTKRNGKPLVPEDRLVLIIYAWNARHGTSSAELNLPAGRLANKNFPKPVDPSAGKLLAGSGNPRARGDSARM